MYWKAQISQRDVGRRFAGCSREFGREEEQWKQQLGNGEEVEDKYSLQPQLAVGRRLDRLSQAVEPPEVTV